MELCKTVEELVESIKTNPNFCCDNCQMFACSYPLRSQGCISNTIGIWRRAKRRGQDMRNRSR